MPGLRRPLVVSLLLALSPLSLEASECPTIPPVPEPTAEDLALQETWERVAEPSMARYAVRSGEEPSYGVGYLDLAKPEEHYYDWVRHVVLPLWAAPEEKSFYGWLRSARVEPEEGSSPYPLTGAGLVETDYEKSSFIVDEAREDGWLRIRLKPGKDGAAWAHRCHLAMGETKLVYKDWQAFLREHGDWLHFRTRVPHVLRAGPSIESPRVTMIGLGHKLILRELRGDWMRVIVEQPDWTCASEPEQEHEKSIHEGWVRWRDEEKGPWVWVYTRGC